MLTAHHSNSPEALAGALAEIMRAEPPRPLAPETVVVPHRSMGHWLSLELAERHGVAANLEFPFLGGLVWRLFKGLWPELPEQSPFDRDALRWRVLACLPAVLERPGFEPLRHYLAGDEPGNGLKAYRLADRLASLYDQYLVYRPDWIAEWQAGRQDHWQAALWRELAGPAGGERSLHRAELLPRFLRALEQGDVDPDTLPPRVAVFGLSSAPPAYLGILAALSTLVRVDVFVLNPSLHYWGDVVSEQGIARLRELWRRHGLPDASVYYTVGNPLLASLGRTGREFLELLHDLSADDADCFVTRPEGEETLLDTVQQDLLFLRERGPDCDVPPRTVAAGDRSIQLHACHSPMREVQVLHDHLRRLLAETDQRPRDIVVMTPDIDRYAPYIEAVFGNAAGDRYIPWSITDRSLPAEHPVVQVFTRLLDLPDSRLTVSEVLSVIEVPAVHRRFGLDEDGVERIRLWVRESGARWGADARHRAEEGLPGWETHSWRFGLNRLLLGYALDDATLLYRDMAPLPQVEGGEAAWLGCFRSFWDELLAMRSALRREHTPADWQALFNRLLETLFLPADAEEVLALQSVRDAVGAVADSARAAGFDGALPLRTVKAAVLDALGASGTAGGYLTGQVTFCAMVPMRSVPFDTVCLIGLNDRDFPRQETPLAFDLMARERRAGDRNLREDDRYLFLEALLCARRCLYLSYVGRSARDNSEKLPSVVVNELMDTLDRGFRASDGGPVADHVLTEHPLQPFSRRYEGDPEARLFSYADDWLRPAERDTAAEPVPARFLDAALPEPDAELRQVDLEDLVRFYLNPAEALLRTRFGTRPGDAAGVDEDSEPFDLDQLAAYRLRELMLSHRLAGRDPEELERVLAASGALPQGAFGRAAMDDSRVRVERYLQALTPLLEDPADSLEVDVRTGGFILTGWLDGLGRQGLLSYRPATLRTPDLLRLWLRHLAMNAMAPAPDGLGSRHLGEDRLLRLEPLPAEQARGLLDDLLGLYWRGLREPLPFFREASLEYARRVLDGKGEEAGLKGARGKWDGDGYSGRPGEKDDAGIAVVFRGREPLEEPEFAGLARRVYEPLLRRCL